MKQVIHGLPINGEIYGKPAIEHLAGGSFLASFFYTRQGFNKLGGQVDRAVELVGDDQVFMLDNGAFTIFQHNIKVREGKKKGPEIAFDDAYLAEYYDWAQDVLDRCPQAVAIVPDVIGGTVEQNLELIDACPLDPKRSLPVWHLNEPIEHLVYLAERFDQVAFGSAGEYWQVGNAAWSDRVSEAIDALRRAGVYPRIHMLRGIKELHKFPFASADSINIAVNHGRQADRGEDLPSFVERVETKANSGPVPLSLAA